MRYMLMLGATDDTEAGVLPGQDDLARMSAYNEELVDSGVLVEGNGLRSSSHGARVSFGDHGRTTVEDGPFAESRELMAGYWIIDVDSKEEAIQWARRAPCEPGMHLDLRKIFEAEDFGNSYTPELARTEQRLRERVTEQRGG